MSSGYIEKIKVMVQLALLGESPAPGSLSLAPYAELHEGPETLLERLNLPTRIVPFHRTSDDATLLVNRVAIEWVSAGPEVESKYVRPHAYQFTREERVRVRLIGGATFEGVLAMELPQEFNRTSDFLNSDDDFFPLTSPSGTLLVNKRRVLEVRVYGASRPARVA